MINLHGELHLTDASSKWAQYSTPIPLLVHCNNSDSNPVHCTSSNQISPLPSPKNADDRAVPINYCSVCQ